LVFVQEYSLILHSIESEYRFPRNQERFRKRKFRYLSWQSKEKERNATIVIRILAERGISTIRDIVKNDVLSDDKIDPDDRYTEYYRIIEGDKNTRVTSFIEKRLVRRVKIKKPRTYELTVFGIFVAIHLFSEYSYPLSNKIPYEEADKPLSHFVKGKGPLPEVSILEAISINYSHLFPLIFGKWSLMKKHLGSMVNVFLSIAHSPSSFDSNVSPFYNTRSLTLPTRMSKQGIYHDEITMLFFSYVLLSLPPFKFKRFMTKDKEIFQWYSKYIFLVLKANKEENLRIQYARALLKGDLVLAKQRYNEIIKIQKIR